MLMGEEITLRHDTRGPLLVFGRGFTSDMCVCVSTGVCTYVSVPQLFVSSWLTVVLCLFSINVLFFYPKMDKNHQSEKDNPEKRNAFMPVRSHFPYTRRHTRTHVLSVEFNQGWWCWSDRQGALQCGGQTDEECCHQFVPLETQLQ